MTKQGVGVGSYVGKQCALILAFWLFWGAGVVEAAPLRQALIVGKGQVMVDPAATATIEQVLEQPVHFADLLSHTPNYGFTTAAYWLRIPVQNETNAAATFYLDIKNSVLDYATLYVVNQGRVIEMVQSGDKMPAQERPYLATTLVLPFHLASGEFATLYVRVKSDGEPLFLPFAVVDEQTLQTSAISAWVLHSALLGVFGALFIYNLFIFSLLRNRLYLYYVFFLPLAYMGVAGSNGFGPAYLYPGNTWLGNAGVEVFAGISFALNILILREFLPTRTVRWLERWLWGFILGALLLSSGPFLWPGPLVYQITAGILFLYPIFCLLAGIIAWRHGRTEVRFYILGQASSWISLILIGLLSTGVIPYDFLIYQSPSLGLALDALLLSFALADRIRILQQARLHAEDMARKNLEIRQEELERLIAERTTEIKTLHGILPICANCKKIRNEEGAWQGLETYISQHTDAQFSHGICGDCMAELYPTIYQKRQQGTISKQM